MVRVVVQVYTAIVHHIVVILVVIQIDLVTPLHLVLQLKNKNVLNVTRQDTGRTPVQIEINQDSINIVQLRLFITFQHFIISTFHHYILMTFTVHLGMNVLDNFLWRFKIISRLIRNFNPKFLLNRHDNLHNIQGIQTEVTGECGSGLESGISGDDLVESFEDIEDTVLDLILAQMIDS